MNTYQAIIIVAHDNLIVRNSLQPFKVTKVIFFL